VASRTAPSPRVWAGIALIILTGLIHGIGAPDAFGDAPYKGVLFILNAIGALAAAYGIYRAERWG